MSESRKAIAKLNDAVVQKTLARLAKDKPTGARTTEEEKIKELALAEHVAGAPKHAVERKYRLAAKTIDGMIKQRFDSTEDYYEFLEGCMLQNAVLANAKFIEKADELTPAQAATAASSFAKTATDIRKARLAGFKEEPVPVNVLLRLQQALIVSNGATT